jgi:Uma2 family endonuclease
MNALVQPELTLQAYLAWEEGQPERHEYHRGEVFAMVGARRVHGRVVNNISGELRLQLKGSPCQVFHEGMKLQIGDDTVLYPDVFVTCDKRDLAAERIFTAPTLIIEVLSPSTQAYDRSQKFAHEETHGRSEVSSSPLGGLTRSGRFGGTLYRRIPALQEYILVDPDTLRVEGFRRGADGLWVLHDMSETEAMHAASVGCTVPLAEVFAGIEPPAEP